MLYRVKMLRFGLIFYFTLYAGVAQAFELRSSSRQVELIQLFTSEGCSSCPPADRWLSNLTSHSGLWSEFIPVSFHVDYWNYLGWDDPYAQAEFSARQRQLKRVGILGSVYTPGLIVNDKEWRQWFKGQRRWPRSNNEVGVLSAIWNKGQLEVQFESKSTDSVDLIFNVALLEMGIESKVAAGENARRLLKHDFVVLRLETSSALGLSDQIQAVTKIESSSSSENKYHWSTLFELPIERNNKNPRQFALAVWVVEAQSLRPVQAVGDYLPE